jgi:hypothetical protein
MEHAKAIAMLKSAAAKSQAIHDMFIDFGTRERARGQVTVRAFYNRMKKAGFTHSSVQYADGLKVLAECGFGELKYNRRGGVLGLYNIRTTLASIGRAVVGKRGELKNHAPRNKYSPIAVSEKPQAIVTIPAKPAPEVKREVLKALNSVDSLVNSILSDESIPPQRRIDAARVLLEA